MSVNINIFTKEFSEQKARRTKISQMLRNKVSQIVFVENHYIDLDFGILKPLSDASGILEEAF